MCELTGLQRAADVLKQFDESEDEAPVVTRLAQFDMKNGQEQNRMDYDAASPKAPGPAGGEEDEETKSMREMLEQYQKELAAEVEAWFTCLLNS